MDDHVTSALAQNSAVLAFEELRGEISLLRRAIEGLTAERRDQPDYGPTLEALIASNEELREWAKKVNERPGIKLSPSDIGGQIEAAAASYRARDREVLTTASQHLTRTFTELQSLTQQARNAYEQSRWVRIVGGASFLGGLTTWAVLAQITVIWP